MARSLTKIYSRTTLTTASEKRGDRTQIFHGLPVPIERVARLPRPARELDIADFAAGGALGTQLVQSEQLLRSSRPPPPRPTTDGGATGATAGWQLRLQRGPLPSARSLLVALLLLAGTGYAALVAVRSSTLPKPTGFARPVRPELVAANEHEVLALRAAPADAASEVLGFARLEQVRRRSRATHAAPDANVFSPRGAGDLLAAGEVARAAEAYAQLAASAPDVAVYSEAARILRLRAARLGQ